MISNTEVESEFCQCGCGEKTNLAAQNNPARGIVKGQPMRFLAGHYQRMKGLPGPEKGVVISQPLEGKGGEGEMGANPIERAFIRQNHEDSAEDVKHLEGGEGENGPFDENASYIGGDAIVTAVADDRAQVPKLSAYSELVFSPKGVPTDPNDVTLIVNGEPLTIKRGDRVITPRRFRECADHATYPVYHQMPDQQRMVVARVMVYPYSCLREDVPEAEYLAQKEEGDAIAREIHERAMEMV